MLQWLLFGGAPLLAAIWIVVAALSATEEDRLRTAGAAAAQGCAALVVIYGLAGAAMLVWMTATTLGGPS